MHKLSELYFGDLEAFDEAINEKEYFKATFVTPQSLSISALKNNRRFVIVGRKGSGKTAVQMHLAEQLHQTGFLTCSFRFSEDLRADDYGEIAKTQTHISVASIANDKKLFLHYDFRDVWQRAFFNRIGQQLIKAGFQSKFTDFVCPKHSNLHNIFSGLSRTLSIKLTADMGAIVGDVGFDPSQLMTPNEIPLKDFNEVSRKLFMKYCYKYRLYFFVDELVFSKLDAREDEITIRAAMVRDIIKS